MLASNYFKIKIIDMENHSVVKEYSAHEDGCNKYNIRGIEKIKIPEKGEFIITYSEQGMIKIQAKVSIVQNVIITMKIK